MTSPVLDTSASPSLPSTFEGEANPAGITVADLIADGSISDENGIAVEAIAITHINTYLGGTFPGTFPYSIGQVQYSLNGGASWLPIQPVLNSSENTLSLLLGPADMLRLLPYADRYDSDQHGTLSDVITFRAWDQSTGSAGEYVEATPGEGGFSSATDTVTIVVSAVNAPPIMYMGSGYVVSHLEVIADVARAVMALPGGQIILAGIAGTYPSNFGLVRYDSEGHLDFTFGDEGNVTTDFATGSHDSANAVAMQADGKLLLAGTYAPGSNWGDFALARYNADGSPDTSFGNAGQVTTPIAGGGGLLDEAHSLAVQTDGKILVAGMSYTGTEYDFSLARYNMDGSLDTTFDGDGKFITDVGGLSDWGQSVVVQPDGKIVVVGYSADINNSGNTTLLSVVRCDPDGGLDLAFGTNGKVLLDIGLASDQAQSVILQADGKILVAGSAHAEGGYGFALLRLDMSGKLDKTFGRGGIATVNFGDATDGPVSVDNGYSVYQQADGKILVAGESRGSGAGALGLARFNLDGSLDTSFGAGSGVVRTVVGADSTCGYSVTQQADGKILVTGSSTSGSAYDYFLARYNPDGSLDTTFGASLPFIEGASPVLLDPDAHVYDAELSSLAGGAGDYSGATITLARHGGASADDHFTAMGNLSPSGSDAVLSGVTIATYTLVAGVLTATFNSNATQARVNEALSSIGYVNRSDEPPASVQIDWTFSDGNTGSQGVGGALAVGGSTTVGIVAIDHAGPAAEVSLVGTATDAPVI